MGTSTFSEILSFVISVIACLGFKDRVWFGHCSCDICSKQYQYIGAIFHFPYMNQQKFCESLLRLNGNLIFPHSKIFSALIMVCKLTSCDVES